MSFKCIKSFKYAFDGIWHCIVNEKNMRIHTAVTLYVFVFSTFFHLSAEKYVALVLTISAVIAAEMVNTAIEQLCDLILNKYNIMAKIAKDVAAGSVLVVSIAAVAVGLKLFWNVEIFKSILYYFIGHLGASIMLILSIFVVYIYVELGPIGLKQKIICAKVKNRK